MYKQFLEAGQIVSTHGIKGELRINPWCDSPEFLLDFTKLYFKEGREVRAVERIRANKSIVLVKFEGIDAIDDAVKLVKSIIYIDRSEIELPEDSYFEQDLIGLAVLDADTGSEYGNVTSVTHTGANDVYGVTPQVDGKPGTEVLIPAIRDVVKKIDVKAGQMLITPLKGLFDDAD